MPTLRVALAQANPTVGALDANRRQALDWARQAFEAGADLLVLPEMFLTGYPVEDLALRESFVADSVAALDVLAVQLAQDGMGDLPVVVGFLNEGPENALAVIHDGHVLATYAKQLLPNYGVFDEVRYFVPGAATCVVRLHGVDVALAICEDIWQADGPLAAYAGRAPGLLVVANGSPYERDKDDVRLALVRSGAAQVGCPLAYVNLVGGQDDLVFDGDSMIVAPTGAVLARAPQFEATLLIQDVPVEARDAEQPIDALIVSSDAAPRTQPTRAPLAPAVAAHLEDPAEVYAALVLGLGDYVRKNGFTSVLLGLSGGIDSALVAAIACDAIGAAHVHGVSLPSQYSSDHSKDDAAELARRTGLPYRVVPIAPMVATFVDTLGLAGLAEENVQARVRGVTLMALSNAEGHLVLATGNKSELAVGYSTIYGDAVGGFAPLKDVPKTLVWELSRWRNDEAARRGEIPPIPEASISKPPSAELRPGQLDTDSLPPYELLDDVLDDYVEGYRGAGALIDDGFAADLVERTLRMTDRAEWKRRQYPPGPKVSRRAFGRDRRLPITNRYEETAPDEASSAAGDSVENYVE